MSHRRLTTQQDNECFSCCAILFLEVKTTPQQVQTKLQPQSRECLLFEWFEERADLEQVGLLALQLARVNLSHVHVVHILNKNTRKNKYSEDSVERETERETE